jgi:hypothetical protein
VAGSPVAPLVMPKCGAQTRRSMQKYFSLAFASLCALVAIEITFAETDPRVKYVMYFPHGSYENYT